MQKNTSGDRLRTTKKLQEWPKMMWKVRGGQSTKIDKLSSRQLKPIEF